MSDDLVHLPLYGCLTGIELPIDRLEVIPGIVLRRVFVDMFGASMLAFAPPPARSSPHPAPWVAVRGGYTFESRVEVAISDVSSLGGLSATVLAWLLAAVLRLQIETPVRMAVLGGMPFSPVAFEQAAQQIGAFRDHRVEATPDDLRWLSEMLPVSARLYHDERFFRAISIYDQSQWSSTLEMGAVLVWSALETLFDLGGEREKTKANLAGGFRLCRRGQARSRSRLPLRDARTSGPRRPDDGPKGRDPVIPIRKGRLPPSAHRRRPPGLGIPQMRREPDRT
jgi:hypothetical protein